MGNASEEEENKRKVEWEVKENEEAFVDKKVPFLYSGLNVELYGLKSTKFNGLKGTIVKQLMDGRWSVELDEKKYDVISFQSENLKVSTSAKTLPSLPFLYNGLNVELYGLKSTKFNGLKGKIVKQLKNKRWSVELDEKQYDVMSFQSENLKVLKSFEPSHKVIAKILTNIYTNAQCNLKLPDEFMGRYEPDKCMICYECLPVLFKFPCGHELCASCGESIMDICNQNCPICRADLPLSLIKWLTMIHIYPIYLTPDIPLEKLQYFFPLICSVANLKTVTKCVRKLGMDVNTKGFYGMFPLHLTSQKSVVQYLVENGANVNEIGANGITPLFLSSKRGHWPAVQYLIEHGAEVNHINNDESSPLLMSSLEGHLPVVQYLVEHGAYIDQVNNLDATALFMSSRHGHLHVVQYLIEHGAQVNLRTNTNASPLFASIKNGHLPIVKYLMEHGAQVNGTNDSECLLFVVAIYENQIEIAKFLLKNNAHIEYTKFLLKKHGLLEQLEILEKLCQEIVE